MHLYYERIRKAIGGKVPLDYMENPGFVSFRLMSPTNAFYAQKRLSEQYSIETKRIEGVFLAIYKQDFEKLPEFNTQSAKGVRAGKID